MLCCRYGWPVGTVSTYRVLAVFWDGIARVLAVFRGSVARILPVLPSIAGFDTAGTACTRGPVPFVLPVLAVFGALVLLILPSARSVEAASTPMHSVSEYMYSILPSTLGV